MDVGDREEPTNSVDGRRAAMRVRIHELIKRIERAHEGAADALIDLLSRMVDKK